MDGFAAPMRRDVLPWVQEDWQHLEASITSAAVHLEPLGLSDLWLYEQTNKGSGHKEQLVLLLPIASLP